MAESTNSEVPSRSPVLGCVVLAVIVVGGCIVITQSSLVLPDGSLPSKNVKKKWGRSICFDLATDGVEFGTCISKGRRRTIPFASWIHDC